MAEVPDRPTLEVRNLSISVKVGGEQVSLTDAVSFAIGRGEVLALVGEFGSGKSVTALALMQLLAANLSIAGGEILLNARTGFSADIARLDPGGREIRAVRGGHMGMVFQEPMSSFSPVHTIGRQIAEVVEVHQHVSRAEARARAAALLAKVGIPNPTAALDRYPQQFSGGMRQRAMIARALVCGPSLLIADEPTTALDVTIQAQILNLLRSLQQEFGMSILFITHDLGIVAQMANRVAIMYAGRIVETGAVREIFRRPAHPYTRALIEAVPRLGDLGHGRRIQPIAGAMPSIYDPPAGCRFHPRCPVAELPRCAAALPPVHRAGGHSVACIHAFGEVVAWTAPLLDVRNLSVRYPVRSGGIWGRATGWVSAVDDVSLSVSRGETMGLVGESGSGKTSFGLAVLRGIQPSEGSVTLTVDGSPIEITALDKPALRRARRHMQMIFQDPYASLNPRMTVRDILSEPLVAGAARGLYPNRRAVDAKVLEIAAACGLSREHLGRLPHAFSGGQRQRIAIARALVLNPELVVCDEPISSLDVSIQAQILNLLGELQDRLGLTYLFIAHDLAAVAYICDRVAVMYLGRIVEIGPTRAVYFTPRHPYTEALMSAVPEPDPDAPLRPILLEGERPDPANPPSGCRFRTRCRHATSLCAEVEPALADRGAGRLSACHHADTITLKGASDFRSPAPRFVAS